MDIAKIINKTVTLSLKVKVVFTQSGNNPFNNSSSEHNFATVPIVG